MDFELLRQSGVAAVARQLQGATLMAVNDLLAKMPTLELVSFRPDERTPGYDGPYKDRLVFRGNTVQVVLDAWVNECLGPVAEAGIRSSCGQSFYGGWSHGARAWRIEQLNTGR